MNQPPAAASPGDHDQTSPFRRAGVEPTVAKPFIDRWYCRILILLIGVGLLTLAFAPVYQFYCAWVGLVPCLLVVRRTTTYPRAFFWGWVAGTLFFIANMWWMAYVTVPGMIGLMAILGLYWGAFAVAVRATGLLKGEDGGWTMEDGERAKATLDPRPSTLDPRSSVHPRFIFLRLCIVAALWVAIPEWLRGTWPWHGLPWLHLGHTQSPILPMCQIADITGVAGISFGVVLINGWVTMFFVNRLRFAGLIRSGMVILALLAITLAYGIFRIAQTPRVTERGPSVMVVQCNYPQSNTGATGASQDEMTGFHLDITYANVKEREKQGTDLVVWSETMMPPINPEAREMYRGTMIEKTHKQIQNMAFDLHTAVLTGGRYWGRFRDVKGDLTPTDDRNSAYLYQYTGLQAQQRYDKIHLVPFGEFIPFKESFPALYRLMINLGPPDMENYQLTAGDDDALTVFPLQIERPGVAEPAVIPFVTPICFEDIDANIVAQMFRPEKNSGLKRAKFMVNLTNDGWFKANENTQHLQAAIFRSIENRAPMARSVNTGVSGFIDSVGRTTGLVPVRTEGVSTTNLLLDSRLTFFTRFGDLFARTCVGVTIVTIVASLLRKLLRRETSAR